MSDSIKYGGKRLFKQPDGTYKAMKPPTPKERSEERQQGEKVDREFAAACTMIGLPVPVSEYRFHETRRWRIDYFFRKGNIKVGLEIEGGVWTNGRHTRGKGFINDMEKYNAAQAHGIYIVRCVPDEKYTKGIQAVKAVFDNLSQGV